MKVCRRFHHNLGNQRPTIRLRRSTLTNLINWDENNHLPISYNKTVVMHCDLAKTTTLILCNHTLEIVRSAKLLGIIIEYNLHLLYMLRPLLSLGTPASKLQHLQELHASWIWSLNLTLNQQESNGATSTAYHLNHLGLRHLISFANKLPDNHHQRHLLPSSAAHPLGPSTPATTRRSRYRNSTIPKIVKLINENECYIWIIVIAYTV